MDVSAANMLRPLQWGGASLGVYVCDGISVEVEESDGPAIVTVHDHARWTVYSVTAEEDQRGRAHLLALGIAMVEAPPGDTAPGRYLDERRELSRLWLARVAVECARGASLIAETDADVQLQRIADTVRRCEREGTSATSVLALELHISKRTVSRRIQEAVHAGFLPERGRGRPKSEPKENDA